MVILFEPEYEIGDTVCLKLNPEKKMMIDAYKIHQVNNKGEVTKFSYSLYDGEGQSFYFTDIDLILVESVEQEDK